jgi:FkbM family methyltransferase
LYQLAKEEMRARVVDLIKKSFNAVGLDLRRIHNIPSQTLLGLATSPFETIIDVGANSGQFAKGIASFFPNAQLICFEPLPTPFAALSSWAKTQGGRVRPLNLALGDEAGSVEMFLHAAHTTSSSLLATTEFSEQYYPFTKEQEKVIVQQSTLDVALREAGVALKPPILIKLDVQGYENRVIAGGNDTFRAAKACILEVCLDELYVGQANFPELVAALDGLGFRYIGNLEQNYAEDGHCIFLDAVFVSRN